MRLHIEFGSDRAPKPPRAPGPGRLRTFLARAAGMRVRPSSALPAVLLTGLGLGLVTAAAWCIAVPCGLVVAGISAWVMEWRITA